MSIQNSKTRRNQRRNQPTSTESDMVSEEQLEQEVDRFNRAVQKAQQKLSSTGDSMTTATATQPEAAQLEEHRWTKAQMRHFNELQGNVAQAQADLKKAEEAAQGFVRYLSEEHDLDSNKQWVIGPHGFVLAPPQADTVTPPSNTPEAAPTSEAAQA